MRVFPLDITWFGHSCFRIVERGRITVVTDPYADNFGLPPLKLKADVVTISHDEPGHNNVQAVKNEPHVVRGAGEYEIGSVFITGLALHAADDPSPRPNVAYHIVYDNLSVLHLGDLAHVPQQSLIERLGEVNALLVPVGGGKSLSAAQAAEVVALIEPHYIIPMHYEMPGLHFSLEPVDKFLKAMGVSKVNEAETLRITMSDLPEQPQVVVLKPQTQ
jgi:L-ascorbate metabolism protein UlaG (beta-lactamase superfamily)